MRVATMRQTALYGLLCCAVGCAVQGPLRPGYVAAPEVLARGGLVQIKNGTGYLSYHAPAPKDAPGYRLVGRARGEVCQNDLRLPMQLRGGHSLSALSNQQTLELIWGNAAVASGVADALAQAPKGAVLYDLTLDLHQTSLLGLFYRRQCLVVSGSLAVPQAEAAQAPATIPQAAEPLPSAPPPAAVMQPAELAAPEPSPPQPSAPQREPALRGFEQQQSHGMVHDRHKVPRRSRRKAHRGSNTKHTTGSSHSGQRPR